jgi:hypothetical protein
MNAKSIVTFALLLFVGVSVAYIVVQQGGTGEVSPPSKTDTEEAVAGDESPGASDVSGQSETTADEAAAGNPAARAPSESASAGPARKVLVYYFHGTQRCKTCRAIESYAHEAIEEAFAEELESGRVVWRTVNVDEPENKHFVAKYGLSFSTLVVAEMEGDNEGEWRNLSDVWSLVKESREKYDAYVRDAVSACLEG